MLRGVGKALWKGIQRALEWTRKGTGGVGSPQEHVVLSSFESTVEMLYDAALAYYRQGDFARAILLENEIACTTERTLGRDHFEYARSLTRLAGLFRAFERLDTSEAILLRVLDLRREVAGRLDGACAAALHSLAKTYIPQDRYEDAARCLRQAIRLVRRTWGKRESLYRTCTHDLSQVYSILGRKGPALALQKLVVALVEADAAADLGEKAGDLTLLGERLLDVRAFKHAARPFLEAIEIHELSNGRDWPSYVDALVGLGKAYWKSSRSQRRDRVRFSRTSVRFSAQTQNQRTARTLRPPPDRCQASHSGCVRA